VGEDGAWGEHRGYEQEALAFELEVTLGSAHHADFQDRGVPAHPSRVGLGQELLHTAREQLLQAQPSVGCQVFGELIPVWCEHLRVEVAQSCAERGEERCVVGQVSR
jgi:hypothetical protein